MKKTAFKSGFVSVVGRPNVGKSTLINAMIKEKIAIVSDKVQTTRNKILCIYTDEDSQIIFMDTPGIHKPHHKLGEYMVSAAVDSLKEVDVVVFMISANEKFGAGDQFILDKVKQVKVPVFLLVNKIDMLPKDKLLEKIAAVSAMHDFTEIIPVSAKEEINLDAFLQTLKQTLKEGPKYFPDDMITDQPERLLAAEIIREKILLNTKEEIPHAIAVEVEEMKARSEEKVYIRATIYVERDSQKRIVIGKNGAMLKEVGALARQEIQSLLGSSVYLDLWVKTKKDWRNKTGMLKELGYE